MHHYFDGKAHLFAETLALPLNPAELIAGPCSAARDRGGGAPGRTFLAAWEPPRAGSGSWPWCARRCSHEEAARMLREFLAREVFGRIARELGVAGPELRGAGWRRPRWSGLAVLRYVVGSSRWSPLTRRHLAALVAPTPPALPDRPRADSLAR